MENQEFDGITPQERHHTKPDAENKDTLFKIRQILNFLFIILAIIGACIHTYGRWYASNTRMEMMGGIIVIIAISMKMAESVLRFKK